MNKFLVEIYLPAAMRSYDVWIPPDVRVAEITPLAANALSRMSGGLYRVKGTPLLCWRESGQILNIDKTPWELGLRNGSRLLLI